jgi:hypothetical protein
MPRHSPYALTYFSLHGLHKYCTRHAGYELDFMLPRILSYYSSAQGPEGPHASFTIQHVKEHPPPPVAVKGMEDSGASIPCPAQLTCGETPFILYNHYIKIISWSYRDSNPRSTASQRQHPCTPSLNQHSTSNALNNQNQNTLWSYRDSNPGPLPCKGSALAS